MRKAALLLVSLAVTMVVAGCSGTPDKNVARENAKEKPKTVVVNKGLSKKEEKKLNDRLDKLEKKVGAQGEKSPRATASASAGSGRPEPSRPQAEDQARAAAEAYYQAVASRNWGYTYDHLDSETHSAYTRQEWFAKNDYLADTGPVTYTIQSVVMDSSAPETVADVTVVLTAADGSTNVRNTYFVYEGGVWKHRFGPEEYDLLASAPTATSSVSASSSVTASSSPTVSPNPSPNPSPDRNDNTEKNGHRGAGSGGTKPTAPRGGGDINCDEVNDPIQVPPGDPNNLDGDGDGVGCEQE